MMQLLTLFRMILERWFLFTVVVVVVERLFNATRLQPKLDLIMMLHCVLHHLELLHCFLKVVELHIQDLEYLFQ